MAPDWEPAARAYPNRAVGLRRMSRSWHANGWMAVQAIGSAKRPRSMCETAKSRCALSGAPNSRAQRLVPRIARGFGVYGCLAQA